MKTTALANSNIAIVKYWGKRDERLNLPQNSSISFTMDEQLSTVTTVEFDSRFDKDELWIDAKLASESEALRTHEFLDLVRARANLPIFAKIVSKNSFPKGAGLASSASGFAALAAAAVKAAGLSLNDQELSILARQGSGSACRSVFGGAVEWQKGSRKDGSDSMAVPLSPPEKWKHLRNVIAIISAEEKKISSRAGMKETVKTSKLYPQRLVDVEQRLAIVRNAIDNTDFESMMDAIMEDSDSMHACMADTQPPIIYMNETSHKIVRAVRELNEKEKIAAYTFDAGPNAHVYTTEKHAGEIRKMLGEIEGVQKVLECRVGEGVRYTQKHLF